MDSPNSNWVGENFPWIIAGGGFVAVVFKKWALDLNPVRGLRWFADVINGPIMQKYNAPTLEEVKGLRRDFGYFQKVFDKLPDAQAAHAAVQAEDEKHHANWE